MTDRWVQDPDGNWHVPARKSCFEQGCLGLLTIGLLLFVLVIVVSAIGAHASSTVR